MERASPAIWKPLAIATIVALLAGNAAAASPNLVVVLPLDVRQAQMDAPTRVALEESIRTVTGDALFPFGFTVLTGETTLAVLADNGIDPERACETSCALETARELKADLFISGTVAFTEGYYTAFIRLFESHTARQLGSLALEGKTVREVRREFAHQANAFFDRLIDSSSSETAIPAVATATDANGSTVTTTSTQSTALIGETARSSSLQPDPIEWNRGSDSASPSDTQAAPSPAVTAPSSFDSIPSSASASLLEEARTKGGPESLVERRDEVMLDATPAFPAETPPNLHGKQDVPPLDRSMLQPVSAWLAVHSEPPGLEVHLDGELLGITPLPTSEMAPGVYTLSVNDSCFHRSEQRLVLAYGDKRTFTVRPEPRTVDLRIDSVNPFREPVVASAWAQGQRLGRVPGNVAVPLCTDRITVENANGRWSADVSLTENSTAPIVAVLTRQGNHVGKLNADESPPSPDSAQENPLPDPPASERKQVAIRLGTGAAAGWMGMTLEWRPGWLGYSVGFGIPSYTIGITLGSPSNNGGLYGDVMFVGDYVPYLGNSGYGLSTTVGWDWRFFDLLTVKTGIGMSASLDGPMLPLIDLAAGAVF